MLCLAEWPLVHSDGMKARETSVLEQADWTTQPATVPGYAAEVTRF